MGDTIRLGDVRVNPSTGGTGNTPASGSSGGGGGRPLRALAGATLFSGLVKAASQTSAPRKTKRKSSKRKKQK